ncbi:MAG: SDR family oxidoreductase [Deltaproteobacteria bacterium]|nr:SDR family oxidoreductase [Deltaproteobacteria bacterium]
MKGFRDAVAVVTGGGSGIGRATARALAAEGARLEVVDIVETRARAVAEEIRGSGGDAVAHVVDCADAEAVAGLADAIFARRGRVDLLHLNAGVVCAGPVEQVPLEEWRRVLGVNLFGPIYALHAFLPRMLARGEGQLVLTSSAVGLFGVPGVAPYVTSKFALVGLAEALAAELGPRGVGVTLLCPGVVSTQILDEAPFGPRWEGLRGKVMRFYDQMGVEPERVARDLLEGLRTGRFLIVSPGWHARPLWWLKRASPALHARCLGWFGRFVAHASADAVRDG